MNSNAVLVIGGGIAGVQASLDLANAGTHVYLVEKSPFLGGRMSQLDKTFPTNDCSMCIQSPKLVEAIRNPNIEVLTNCEVRKVWGSHGDFKVVIHKEPRYVTKECTACDDCSKVCPVMVPNEFDMGLTVRKAIYTPFPQAVPSTYVIDRSLCLNKGHIIACEKCIEVCQPRCIDFLMREEDIEIGVAAIIVATGGSVLDPRILGQYGYGKYPDVLTNLEFERMINASGPTNGHLIRLSDGREPRSLLFILCVGSRDVNFAPYCSRVCCMYSIKQSLMAREHAKGVKDLSILYIDVRAFGKGFEEYYNRAVSEGINFIRGKAGEVVQCSDELAVRMEDTETGDLLDLKAEMVVLASAITPSPRNKVLADVLGIELDEDGFFRQKHLNGRPLASTREGIYLCGLATGPKDITDSVLEASGAASLALAYVKERSHPIIEIPETPADEEPRIGVFVCHCGNNIAGIVDVADLREYSKKLKNVVYAEDLVFACSEGSIEHIIEKVKENRLNRVVIPACSPKTHEPLFKDALIKAGLNPYLLDMANIRNQCSWVHSKEPEKATKKAKDLTRMSVARANRLEPLFPSSAPIRRSALVVGGGIAGITASLDLEAQGIETYLVEKEERLGGRLLQLHKLSPRSADASEILKEKLEALEKSKVQVFTSTEVKDIKGFVGNFEVTLSGQEDRILNVGAIILAIGTDIYQPKEYGYGKYGNVITNLELEKRMKEGGPEEKIITFIQCVGARNKEFVSCSRYCCETAIHQAYELCSNRRVNFLFKDIRTFGKGAEELYREAAKKGVKFFRFEEEPEFDGEKVSVKDMFSGLKLSLPADLLVLSVSMRPNNEACEKFQKLLKLPRSSDGYMLEKHPKLGPVETGIEGIFLAGCASGPRRVEESVASAHGASAKAASLLSKDNILVDPMVAIVDEERCRWCGQCRAICEYNAVELVAVEDVKVARVNPALCKGCGMCVVECPTGAMSVKGYANAQIETMIDAMMEEAL